jgi:hypothetical protein
MIDYPKLKRGLVIISIPHHQGYVIDPYIISDKCESVNGTVLEDFLYSKYGAVIHYDAIHRSDYEAIRAFLDNAIINNQVIYFRYDKFNVYASSWHEVVVTMSGIKHVRGSGLTNFYYSFDLTFEDAKKR